ncbi:MAG: hypothetical protein MR874_01100 [Coriobacteriaceae bacterium]|nr:hypothetical protein [Coriobacteriaceae bacterium]MCI6843345.1 hypothetical protein [Coriobacteriaceae bacterium]
MSMTSAYADLCAGDGAARFVVGCFAADAARRCDPRVANDHVTEGLVLSYVEEYLDQEQAGLHRLSAYLDGLGVDGDAIDRLSAEDLGRIVGTAAAHHALADIEWAAEGFGKRMYADDDPSLDGLALGLASGGTQSHEGGDER